MSKPQRESWKETDAELFRLLVENVTDYAIFILDPEGHVASWNPGAERIKGYKADEIIGQHFTRFYPQEAIDRGWPAHELKVAAAEGRFEDEGWRVRKDGSRFWANVVITALKDDRGNLLGFSKITRDLTARKQAEENARRLAEESAARQAAHEERERLRVTLASIGDAVISTDAQGRVEFLNPVAEALVGWRSGEAAGRALEDVFRIVNENTRQPVENPALRALREGVVVGLANHTVLISKDGAERPIDDSAAPIRTEQGHVSGSVLVFRDISERKRSEAALAERVRLLALNAAVGAALVRGDSLGTTLQRCAEALVEHLHGAFARIWLLDPQGEVLELRASAGLYTHLDGPHSRVPVGQYKIGLIAQERKPHLTNAVVGDPRVSDQEWAKREGMTAFAGYPLLVDDRLVGVIAMFARQPLSEATLEAMASVADEIAIGIERKVGQDRLDEQREWLRVTLASIGDAVITTDTEGRVTFLNGVAQALTGWAQDDAQGQALEAVFAIRHEQTGQPVENPVAKVLREGRIVGLGNHTVLLSRDGTVRPIDDSAAPIRDAGGRLLGVVLIFRDVTEQRQAEREVRQNEARKRAILDTALDCIITMDHEGKVVEFNPAAERTFGHRREQVIGRALADLIIPPSLRERHHRGMAHYLATGEGPVLGKRIELPALRADGTEFPVELAIARIPTDGPPLFTAYLRDISEPKRAEQRRNTRLAVTQALSEAAGVREGVGGVLRAVCENLGWDVGFFWTVSDEDTTLVCMKNWHRQGVRVEEFETASRSRTFRKGDGLPGRVWASGKPAWILDIAKDQNFPRLASAVEYDLHSAFACPVAVGGNTLGVIEFFTRYIREADADLLEMMDTVAGQVGQFIERKAAEDDLRRSEEELADFFENATVGLHWVGPDGTILSVNKAELDMLGYSREEYVGRPISDFHADEDVICDILKRLQAGENLSEYPARLKCKDGSIKDVLIDSSVMWRDGQFVHTRCFTRDVTDRRRAEEALRHSEERFRSLMEQAPFSIQVFSPDGRTIRVNRAWEELWGVRFEQIEGYNILEDKQLEAKGVLHYIHQGFAGQAARIPAIQYNPNETIPDITKEADPRRWLSAVIYPIRDAEGRVREVVLIHEDITARKRAEEELQRSERQSRTILESITDAFCALDRDWRFTYVNRQAEVLLGRSRDDLLGKNHWEVYPDTLGTELESTYRRAVRENVTGTLEHFYPPHDRWYEVHAYPSPEGLSVYFRDVSQRRRAEAALRESEEKLRLLADTIPQLAWMARPDGHIFWYNRRWYEYTGTTREQMEGWGWQAVHDPEALPKVLERWKGSIASGEPFDMVFPLKGADGQFRPFLTRVNPLRDEAGRILYWFGTNTDISDIRRMEESLRQSEQRFRQLADAMPQIVWTAGPDGNLDYLNRRWTEFTGLPDTVGNEAWGQLLHPDDAPAAHQRWAASVESGAPFEMEIRLLDRRRHTYRWHLIRTVAVRDETGRVARWFGTGTDIHEQKRAEESSRYLAEASAALASVVDYESTLQKVANLAVPYFADWSAVDVADDGRLRRLAVAHQDPGKIRLAQDLMRDYPPDPEAPVGAVAVLRTGKPELVSDIPDELLVQGARDERHLRLLRSLGLKSYICVPLVVSGKALGVLTFATAESGRSYTEADLALAMDLAHRAAVAIENTQLYQALRETDRRKDEFLATLAHELRNPLAPIRNSLQILKMPRVDAETAERSREMMERQVHHLVRLVDDLLDVSRVMRGKIELRRERVELAAVVARAVETVQPLVDAQRHQLSVSLPTASLPIDADPVRLTQVVGNLLTNAAKYTDPGGRIWLTVERDGETAVLRVRDTGIGIAAHMLPRIFELFVQVDHASTKAQGGLGIGLTLVKNLVEMHNGTVEAHSEGLGQGSEFIVRLPLSAHRPDRDQGRESGQKTDEPPSPSGFRLLVVDDNQDAANSLAMLLRLQGHEVRVAYSGVAALERTKDYKPDVVFLDIGMPGMDGYEVARRLRQLPGLERVVLAALTGWGQKEDRRRSAEAGFDHHLVKPPEPRTLEGVLGELRRRD